LINNLLAAIASEVLRCNLTRLINDISQKIPASKLAAIAEPRSSH